MMLEPRSVLGAAFGEAHQLDLPRAGGLTLTECSGGGCLLLSVAIAADGLRDILSDLTGVDLPMAPGAVVKGDRWAIWLTPRSWLLACAEAVEDALLAAVGERFPDRSALASRYADSLCWLSLSGDGAEDLLRQGSFLSLDAGGFPVGHVKRTPVADVPVLVWRQAPATWRLGLERSRAAWFINWLRMTRKR